MEMFSFSEEVPCLHSSTNTVLNWWVLSCADSEIHQASWKCMPFINCSLFNLSSRILKATRKDGDYQSCNLLVLVASAVVVMFFNSNPTFLNACIFNEKS